MSAHVYRIKVSTSACEPDNFSFVYYFQKKPSKEKLLEVLAKERFGRTDFCDVPCAYCETGQGECVQREKGGSKRKQRYLNDLITSIASEHWNMPPLDGEDSYLAPIYPHSEDAMSGTFEMEKNRFCDL